MKWGLRRWVLMFAACASGPDAPPDDTGTDSDTPDDGIDVDAGTPVWVAVGDEVKLIGAGPTGAAEWDLGDGTTASGTTVTHTYDAPGNLTATLSVTPPGGRRRVDSTRVVVYERGADRLPVSASSVVVHLDTAFVVEPDADRLVAVDLLAGTTTAWPTCAHPRTVAVTANQAAVACEDDDAVWVFERSGEGEPRVVELGVGSRPFGIVPDGDGWAVSLQGTGEVARVDATGAVNVAKLGRDPRALTLDDRGDAWSPALRARQDGGDLWGERASVHLSPDPGPDSDTGNRGVPTGLRAAVASPNGRTLYVGGTVSNVERGLVRDELPLSFEVSVRATLRVVDLGTAAERFDDRKQFDNHGTVDALALSPLGNWLWVAHAGTHTIERVDAYTLRAAGVILDAGSGIDGMAVTPTGDHLVVHAALDRELRVYDVSDPSRPLPPRVLTAATVANEPLAANVLLGKRLFHEASDARLGKDGYLSCDACHPDGRDDGLVWDFTQRGEGLRNTTTLEGRAGTGMGPVHWSGNFDEIQDFENDLRLANGGTGLLADADWAITMHPVGPSKAGRSAELDALAAYVATLDRTPASPFAEPDGGAAAFEAAGCTTCHDPARGYTDSLDAVRHDVGTLLETSGQRLGGPLDGIDTPTLLGAQATGPWLHDGRAATVEAAIAAHTSALALSTEQISLLADFVRSL